MDAAAADFQIPPDSPHARVCPSPCRAPRPRCWPEARPRFRTSLRWIRTQTLTVTCGPGAPQFAPIPGTPLQYAVNTPSSVIKVSDSSYYACQGGVWFSAAAPTGIWRVASYVPKVIYTIPPSSPLYPVTFVYVYNAVGVAQTAPQPTPAPRPEQTYQTFSAQEMSAGDRANLYNGYMTGYAGTYYGQWGGAAYGTGYYSPGYYGSLGAYTFYGYPQTYGNYNDTTFARDRAEIGNGGPSAQFDPSTGTYTRTGPPSGQHYGPPGNATSIVTSADNNVYADPGGVFREQQGAWQIYSGAAGWTSAPSVPQAVTHDAAARAKHPTAG